MYILILTLMVGKNGGVTSFEVESLERCKYLGNEWVKQVNKSSPIASFNGSFYLCKKK